jgi:preprotein translocase subunit SecG
MTLLLNFMLGIYVIVALLMVLVILMQRPKSEGLGAAFGGGVTENIFGAQTTNVLVKFTTWLAGLFFMLTFVLSILYAHRITTSSNLRQALMKNQTATKAAVAVTPVPAVTKKGSPGLARPIESPVKAKPEDAAVGVVPPASAPLAPSAVPSATASPKP